MLNQERDREKMDCLGEFQCSVLRVQNFMDAFTEESSCLLFFCFMRRPLHKVRLPAQGATPCTWKFAAKAAHGPRGE